MAVSKLSVVIIVRDEAARIRPCLESVRWADEIVVLDSGSDDGTPEICREYTDRVYVDSDWQGFGVQKNRVLAYATSDWVLSLDADERVSEPLRTEIEAVIRGEGGESVYEMPRLSSYCGREMRHSGWWPDHVARLFRRGSAEFSNDLVHERLLFSGSAGRLSHPLKHQSFDSLEQVLDKVNRYSTAGAQRLLAQGRKGSVGRAVLRGFWTFLRTWLFKAGFLDGREGFLLAVSNAEGVYYKYVKLHYLQQRRADGSRGRPGGE